MKLWICSGYPLSSPKGNSVTARRIELLLRDRGFDATAIHHAKPEQADAMIALNAIKTAGPIQHFHRNNPLAPIHVMLTGTDIHQGIKEIPELATQIFTIATTLIVAHPECIHEIDPQWHPKLKVVYPSVKLPELSAPPSFTLPTFTCLGHLRKVKNSHLMNNASLLLNHPHQAISLGDSLDQDYARQASLNSSQNPAYSWVSGMDRQQALSWMKGSLATLNTSYLEGGANTVIEAVQLGIPVLATNIDGNRGLLGADYKGLFPCNNAEALATLMARCIEEPEYLKILRQQLAERLPLFAATREQQSWETILTT